MFKVNTQIKRKFLNLILCFCGIQYKSVFIGKRSRIKAPTYIDIGTRINGSMLVRGKGELYVGKYCAIAEDLRVATSNHDVTYLNMQLALQEKIGAKKSHNKAGKVMIGNNVWIGDAVIILPGVKIGNGAVIGAGSVVTKDVEDFGIYAGNPAKLIRKRFSDELIDVLSKIDWWNWGEEKLISSKTIFNKAIDIESFEELKKLISENS